MAGCDDFLVERCISDFIGPDSAVLAGEEPHALSRLAQANRVLAGGCRAVNHVHLLAADQGEGDASGLGTRQVRTNAREDTVNKVVLTSKELNYGFKHGF